MLVSFYAKNNNNNNTSNTNIKSYPVFLSVQVLVLRSWARCWGYYSEQNYMIPAHSVSRQLHM